MSRDVTHGDPLVVPVCRPNVELPDVVRVLSLDQVGANRQPLQARLGHVFDHWKHLRSPLVADHGEGVEPLQGDGPRGEPPAIGAAEADRLERLLRIGDRLVWRQLEAGDEALVGRVGRTTYADGPAERTGSDLEVVECGARS